MLANKGDHVTTPAGPGRVVGRYWEKNRFVAGRRQPNRLWIVVLLENGKRTLVPHEKIEPQQLTLATGPQKPDWA